MRRCEAKLTYMPFFIKAASLALHKTPILNSHLSPTAEELTYKADHNISIAVNSAKGLVVPNIKAVQSQSVFEIAGELERLVALAQEGTLPADDLADGTHTHRKIGLLSDTHLKPICSRCGFKTNPLHDDVFLVQGHLRCRTLARLEGRMRPRW